jgi:hypothetical protein
MFISLVRSPRMKCKIGPIASLCLSVGMYQVKAAEQIFVKFDISELAKIFLQKQLLVNIALRIATCACSSSATR